ncbi:hypothetical protein L596_019729 [Steinernema carpocapsae]|uniref:Hint domain-containing protein n=1 Tax=Steinernema carpocapsae TaxID=34508 RepID=A0A4U5MS92_STECR|nr:hypothetical protein L596_019729 [Steinernema carpocapsae]
MIRTGVLVLLVCAALGSAVFCGRKKLAVSVEVLENGEISVKCGSPYCAEHLRNPRSALGKRLQIKRISHSGSSLREHDAVEAYFPDLAPYDENRGEFFVKSGEIIRGGVDGNGNFDYLKEIIRMEHTDEGAVYKVVAGRVPCADALPKDDPKPKVYQAPIVEPEQTIVAPDNLEVFEDTNLDELVTPEPTSTTTNASIFGFHQPPPNQGQGFQGQAFQVQPFQGQVFQPQPQPLPVEPVQPIQFYQPVIPTIFGGGGYGLFCFSDDTMVKTADGRKIRMDEITMKDWLMSFNGSKLIYSKMETWLHRMPKLKSEFFRFKLENGKMLKLTAKHYIYKSSCSGGDLPLNLIPKKAFLAEDVNVGDCLFTVSDNYDVEMSPVTKIDIVEQTGIYAPMTTNGNIIVNDVLASCHSVLRNEYLYKTFQEITGMMTGVKNFLLGKDASAPSSIVDLPVGTGFVIDLMTSVLPSMKSF